MNINITQETNSINITDDTGTIAIDGTTFPYEKVNGKYRFTIGKEIHEPNDPQRWLLNQFLDRTGIVPDHIHYPIVRIVAADVKQYKTQHNFELTGLEFERVLDCVYSGWTFDILLGNPKKPRGYKKTLEAVLSVYRPWRTTPTFATGIR